MFYITRFVFYHKKTLCCFIFLTEYDTLSRLGIPDPKSYIKKKFKSEPLVFLSSCCVGPVISEQVQYSVDETLGQGGWLDIMVRYIIFSSKSYIRIMFLSSSVSIFCIMPLIGVAQRVFLS